MMPSTQDLERMSPDQEERKASMPSTEPVPKRGPLSDSNRGATVFVWGVWALLLLACLAYVWRFGSGLTPYSDDWCYVELLTGEQPLTVGFLWAQHNEHRIPIGKFIWLELLKLTGCDFRIGMFVNVLVLAALALAMMRAAKNVRGRSSYADAFLPLILLQVQWLNFIWWWEITNIVQTLLAGVLLLIIVQKGARLTSGAALATGACLVLLTLSGPSGFPYVLALSLWLGYWRAASWRSPEPRSKRSNLLALGLACAAVLLVGLYFVGWERPSGNWMPAPAGLRATLRTSVQFLSVGIVTGLDPTGWAWKCLGLGMLGVGLASLAATALVWYKRPQERLRAAGLFLFVGAVGALALSLGRARSGFDYGFGATPYYAIFAVLAPCCAYFVWEIYAPSSVSHFGQMCMFALAFALLPLNIQSSLCGGKNIRGATQAFERDLLAGDPSFILAERHFQSIFNDSDNENDLLDWEKSTAERLRKLHDAGIGQFQLMREDPVYREILLPAVPTTTNRMAWEDDFGYGLGKGASLTFALGKHQLVYAIRLSCIFKGIPAPSASFRMSWSANHLSDLGEVEHSVHVGLVNYFAGAKPREKPREKAMTIWVNDTIDHLRIYPIDDGFTPFKISAITLLLPTAETGKKP